MKLDRIIAVQSQATARITDAYSAARTYHETHEQIIDRMMTIFNSLPKGTPRHVQTYLKGYWHGLADQVWRNDTIFGAWIDGEFYCHERGNPQSVDARGLSYSEFARMLNDAGIEQHAYWKGDTSKVYS